MSALPPKADIPGGDQHVCFLPIADMALLHSVTNRRSSTRHKRQNVGFGSPLLSTTAIVCVVCSTRPIAQGHRKPGSKSKIRAASACQLRQCLLRKEVRPLLRRDREVNVDISLAECQDNLRSRAIHMSAFGGKADIAVASQDVCF